MREVKKETKLTINVALIATLLSSFRRMFLLNLQEELGLERSNLMEKFYCNKSVEQKIELKFSSKHFNFTIIISLLLLIVSSILMSKLSVQGISSTFTK